ncbi:hypothetical protein K5V07_06145 [Flavobacterium sp. CHNK8]|uniref:hypothetical protein n=1 Tax=Flavobacterium sp. CHNK8 TaxID=2871165 RepID=UPI001C8E744C|nr:hypothetical protein [Flavobacterium sp. CHNK8]QZK90093.1 hypothetical protein K5V07_06145 [Flavobacterium sp. CHNK8]
MIKRIFVLIIFFSTFQSYSQKIVYKSNGNILDSEREKITPNQVRELLKDNQQLLADYNIGRTKKTVGNILLISGPVLLFTGTMAYVISGFDQGMNPEFEGKPNKSIPIIIMGTGLAALLITIPVKIGFSKKIKNVVTDYNNQNAIGNKQFESTKVDLITNSNGVGLRLTLK